MNPWQKRPPEKWSTEEKNVFDKTNEFIFNKCLSKKSFIIFIII